MKKTVKVLYVLPKIAICGGIESYSFNYYRNFDRKKCTIDFIAHEIVDKDYVTEIESYGGKVYEMPQFSVKNMYCVKKSIEDFFKEHKGEYDIIHCHMANAACFYFNTARKYGVKICILHSHQSQAADTFSHGVRNYPLLMIGKRQADVYMACSKLAGDFLFGKKEYILVNNAIDSDKFKFDKEVRDEVRKKLNIENNFVVGHVGRFTAQKNQLKLLDIFYELLKKCTNAKLLLIGNGKDQTKIEDRIKELGISENVIVYGVSYETEKLFQAMDVFVLPSLYEGLPVAAVEAQASGLPCVISDTVSQQTDITGNVKFEKLSNNSSQWADTIVEFCRFYKRKDTTDKIKENGYDIKVAADKLINTYIQLVNNFNS